jgi:protochlorophyllide reductase
MNNIYLRNDPVDTKSSLQMAFNFFGGMTSGASAKVPASKKVVVITGTSSGLGKETAADLLRRGNYYVVCAVRDVEKMQAIADQNGFDPSSYTILECDLNSFDSTRKFYKTLKSKISRPIDRLVCNAAVYQPSLMQPKYSPDDIEEQLQTNHLSHFLLCSLMLPEMKKIKDARMIIVGSITGNSNTIGGGLVLPLADLGDLSGLEKGAKRPISMIDGKEFNGAKSYKDSKICNMMTVNELHERYHTSTGVTFSSMYPGCIAESNLFREKRLWFRKIFPLFMKYVTGGYVSEVEAGQRLADVVDADVTKKSGVYWSWNGGARSLPMKRKDGSIGGTGGSGGAIFENTPSDLVADRVNSKKMWDYSTKVTGAKWI